MTDHSPTEQPAVLVDLYGTLVEPDWPALEAGRAALAREAGVSPEAARLAWATTHESRMRGEYGSLEADIGAVFSGASGGRVSLEDALLRELAARERANWRHGVRLYSDGLPALRALGAAGIRVGIVTNASTEAASVIPDLDLHGLVEFVLVSCEAGVLKPELLEQARRRLDVPAGQTILVDDERRQVDAAAGMGFQTVLVGRPAHAPEEADGRPAPGHVVADLSRLPALVLSGERALRR
ncbi:MAG: HAD family hydrolase [Chloroflexota bacterium]|nr:HAD family hydrolase [Chloroflexota bacterium]